MRRLRLFAILLLAVLAAGCGGGGGSAAGGGSTGTTAPLQGGRLSIVLDASARQDRMDVQGEEVLLQTGITPSRVLIRLLDDTGKAVVGDTELSLDPANPTERRSVTITGIPFGTWKLAITTFGAGEEVYSYFETFVTIGAGGSTSVRALSVTGLVLSASGTTVPVGLTGEVGVVGVLSNGSTIDLSGDVVWSVSDPSRANIQRGRLDGLAVGPVQVTARYGPLSASQSFTIVDAVLQSLQVDPPTASVAAGFTQAFTATGTFSDGVARDVTSSVAFITSDAALAATSAKPGVISGLKPGTVTVTARHDATGVAGTASLTVTPALLQSVQVEPLAPSVPLGVKQQFRAQGSFSDGTVQDLTTTVQWSSSDAAVATVSNLPGAEGLASTFAQGTATVKALHVPTGLFAETTLTVTAAELASLDVSPKDQGLPKGRKLGYTATGTYTDGSVVDLTQAATWSSSDPAVAVLTNGGGQKVVAGVATGLEPGAVTVAATIGNVQGTTGLTVTAAVLESLALDSAAPTFPAGRSMQVNATGVYSDGTSRPVTGEVTWSSLAPAVATVSNAAGSQGLVTGLAPGPVGIRATDAATGVTQVLDLEVTAAVLESIGVTSTGSYDIPLGRTLPLTATGTWSDGTTRDVTQEVNWFTNDPPTASVSFTAPNKGIVTGQQVGGPVTVTAEDAATGVKGTRDVTVTAAVLDRVEVDPPAAFLPVGRDRSFTATGVYSDGTRANLSRTVRWESPDASIATVSATGVARGVAAGEVELRAVDIGTGLTGLSRLTVTNAVLVNLEVTPALATLPEGRTEQYQATGVFSDATRMDLTDSVTWSSPDAKVAGITGGGLVTAVSAGTTTVSAFDPASGTTGTTGLTVVAAVLDALEILPDPTNLPLGRTQDLQARGTYSNGQVLDLTSTVTWTSSDATVASVQNSTPAGRVEGRQVGGPVTITATHSSGVTDTASVTVTPAVLDVLMVTPASDSVPAGLRRQFTVQGVYSDSSTLDLTEAATWSSSDPSVATVSNAAGIRGLATTFTQGETTIEAALDGVKGQATLAATAPELTRIDVTPQDARVPEGRTVQFTATGVYTDGNTADLTGTALWSLPDDSVGVIDSMGLARGIGQGGPAEVRALVGDLSGVSSLTVESAVLEKLQIVADDGTSAAAGVPFPLRAEGLFSNGAVRDLTAVVDWSSDDTSVATVTGGTVTGKAPGTANITATDVATGLRISETVTINPAVLQSIRVQPAGGVANDPLPVGVTRQYEAIGVYSDGERVVTEGAGWRTDSSAVVVFTNPGDRGKVQGAAVGTAHVYAAVDGVEGGIEVQVSEARLERITLEPTNFTLIAGATVAFKAKGEYSDGSAQEINAKVSWTSSAVAVASVASDGVVTGFAEGTATITATDLGSGLSASTDLRVVEITRVEVSPANVQVFFDQGPVQLKALADLSDGSTGVDVTQICNWRLLDGTAGSVDKGLLTARADGQDTVFAREPGGKGFEGTGAVTFTGPSQ